MNPQPDQNDVSTALGLLRDSLAEEEQRIRIEGAKAMQGGDYDTATSVIGFAKRLLAFQNKVEGLVSEWDELEDLRDAASPAVQEIVSMRFPRIPLAKADAGASPGARFLRAKGPAPYQPRATPWVTRRKNDLSPEGATQPVRHRPMARPFRAQWERNPKPRAMPWAGMDRTDGAETARTFGAEETERALLFHDTVAPHLAAYAPEASAAQQRDYLTHLHQTLNAPSHPIRNRLLRLTADSPDLLAIIKQEGKV